MSGLCSAHNWYNPTCLACTSYGLRLRRLPYNPNRDLFFKGITLTEDQVKALVVEWLIAGQCPKCGGEIAHSGMGYNRHLIPAGLCIDCEMTLRTARDKAYKNRKKRRTPLPLLPKKQLKLKHW